MNLHPFLKCVDAAAKLVAEGATVRQQWLCAHCGVKQTMEVPNKFFRDGKCEECGRITHIDQDGCNYMLIIGLED